MYVFLKLHHHLNHKLNIQGMEFMFQLEFSHHLILTILEFSYFIFITFI